MRARVRSHYPVLVTALLFSAFASGAIRAQGPPPNLPQQAAIDVDGDVDVLFEDSAAGARLVHFLRVGNQRLRLDFGADAPPELLSGSKIRAHGRLRNNSTLELSSSSGGSVQVLSLAQPNTFGEQRTLVLLVNFQDNTSASTDTGSAYTTTFQAASNYYLENTYGQTWLTGDAHGTFTLPMNSTTCDYNQIATLADNLATANGINIAAYPRRVYAFPRIAACSWWGLGSVGGNPSRAWVNGTYSLKVVSHELGHNFGAYHSHSQPCDLSGCTTLEYGDDHDDMGQTSNGHFNAFQKERLGWLNYGSSPAIQIVSAAGSYWVDSYEVAGTAPKALKLLKSTDQSGNKSWYYVEVRSQTGFDASDAPGVLVHTGSDVDGNSSQQLDLDATGTGFDALLDVGQTLSDDIAGLSITTTSVSSSGAWLNVTYAGPACAAAAPTVSLSPSATVVAAPGQPVTYAATIRSNDGSTCATTNFVLGWTVPGGWTAAASPSSVNVAPGATGTANFVLTPASSAAGTYSFDVLASRTNTTGPGGSVSGNVLVAAGLDVSLAIAPGTGNSGYQLTATVRVGSSPVSGAPATFTVTDPLGGTTNLTATTNGSGVATVKFRPRARGTYQVRVSASSNGLIGGTTGSFVQ